MAGVVVGEFGDGFAPTGDTVTEGLIDVLEGGFGGLAAGGIAGLADVVEDATGGDGLAGFVGEEGVFEGDVVVGRCEFHGLLKLVAGALGFADFEERVGEILADGDAFGSELDGLFEQTNGLVELF